MKKAGLIVMIVGIVLLIIGIYGFAKVGSYGQLYDAIASLGGGVGGFDGFAIGGRVWLTIVGALGTVCGIVLAKKSY